MTQAEIDRILALQPKYKFELYSCPGIVIGVIEIKKGFTMDDALNELRWIAEFHAEIEARRQARLKQ